MKDIKGYEGQYAITSCGRVWSYRRKMFLKPHITNWGYLTVNLYKDGKYKTRTIHRLVAEAYIPNPLGLSQINHIDEDKTHNYINNLEWCDAKYNTNYGTRTKKAAAALSKAIYCVELEKEFESATQAAKELGLIQTAISRVLRGGAKTHGGYHWRWVNE